MPISTAESKQPEFDEWMSSSDLRVSTAVREVFFTGRIPCHHHGGHYESDRPCAGSSGFSLMLSIRDVFEQHYVPNHPQLKPRTLERYRLEILRWERFTRNPSVSEITTEVFNRFRRACLDYGLRATTIEAGIRTVLQVLRLAGPETERRQGLGLIPRVPFVGHSLRAVFRQKPVPTVDALRRLCYHADHAIWPPNCDHGPWWRSYIGFSFVTGLRLTDMLTIQRRAWVADVVRWTAHKTDVEHVFVLPGWLMQWMDDLPVDGELLFPCRRLPCFVRRELSRICVAAQIDRITPHAIRRASVTEWSIVDRDCGQLIHGEGLGIRDLYANPERLLRAKIDKFPDLSKR